MASPLVSVCIPTYNHAQFISETLESVVSQRNVDFEIIIIDDCSTDATVSIAQKFAMSDQRVKVYINKYNIGMVPNWNRCLKEARGKFIKFVFGDDYINSTDALQKMTSVIASDDDIVLVATARHVIGSDARIVTTTSYFPGDLIADGIDVINLSLCEHNNIIGEPSAVMFRKSFALRGFDPRYHQIVDLEMWFHLMEQGKFAFIAEPLCTFRQHQEQQTCKNVQELVHIDDYFLLFKNYLSKQYISLSFLQKRHILYYQFYYLWKLASKGFYNKVVALHKIAHYYGKLSFFMTLPLYKLYNPIFKLTRLSIRAKIR